MTGHLSHTADPPGTNAAVTRAPQPAPPSRIFALAWLVARGFTKDRIGATFAYPGCLAFLIPSLLMGRVYESSDTHGLVLFWRRRRNRAVIAVAVLAGVLIYGLLFWWSRSAPDTVLGIGWGALLLMVVWPRIVGLHRMNTRDTGSETPQGHRWHIAGVVQRPGTRMSAVLLAWALMDTVPRAGVVVAAAPDKKTFKALQRFGFSPGNHKRVFMLMRGPTASA